MENTPQPFIENQNLPTTPPPSSNKKKLAILAVVGVLILGAASYFLAGGNLFKGQLKLEELEGKIENLIVRKDNGDHSLYPPTEGKEIAFEVVQDTERQIAIWTNREIGEYKILHAKATAEISPDKNGNTFIYINNNGSYIIGADSKDKAVFRYCVSTETDKETCNEEGNFRIAYNEQRTLIYKILDDEGRFDTYKHRLNAPAAQAAEEEPADEMKLPPAQPAQPADPEEPAPKKELQFTAEPSCRIVAKPSKDRKTYTVEFKDISAVDKFNPALEDNGDNWQWTWSNIPELGDANVTERTFERQYNVPEEAINQDVTMAVKPRGDNYQNPITTTCNFQIPVGEVAEEMTPYEVPDQSGVKTISPTTGQVYATTDTSTGTNATYFTKNQVSEITSGQSGAKAISSTTGQVSVTINPSVATIMEKEVSANFELTKSRPGYNQVTAYFQDTSTSSPDGIISSREWSTNDTIKGIDVEITENQMVFIWDGEATTPTDFDIEITLTIKDNEGLSYSITKTFHVSTTDVVEAKSTSYLLNNKEKDGNGLINNLLKVSNIGFDTTNDPSQFSYAVADHGASIFLQINKCTAGSDLINIKTLGNKEKIENAISDPTNIRIAKLDIEAGAENSQCGGAELEAEEVDGGGGYAEPTEEVVEETTPVDEETPVKTREKPQTDVKITMACTVDDNKTATITIKPTAEGSIYTKSETPELPLLTWYFGDGNITNDISIDEGNNYFVRHFYDKGGKYTVGLKVTLMPKSEEVQVKENAKKQVRIISFPVSEEGLITINKKVIKPFAESEVICDVPEDKISIVDDGKEEEPAPKVATTSSTGNMCSIVSDVTSSSNTKVDQGGSIVDCSINTSNISNTSKSNVTNVINNYYGSSTTDTKTATATDAKTSTNTNTTTTTTTKPATTEVVVKPKEIAATGKFEALDCYQTKNYITYQDIPDTHYYYKFIDIFSKTNTLTAEGEYDPIIHGYAGNGSNERLFGADRNITRAEASKVVTRASCFFDWAESKKIIFDGSNAAKFKDLAKDFWGINEIDALSKVGIISGYTDGTFRPNNQITRAEFVKINLEVFKRQQLKTCNEFVVEKTPVFKDADNSEWSSEIAPCAKYYQIWLGSEGNLARPNDNITRGEAMTILNNFVIASGKVVER